MEKLLCIRIGFLIALASILLFSCKKEGEVIEIDREIFEVTDHIKIGQTMTTQVTNMPSLFPILDSLEYRNAYIYVNRLLSTLKLTSVVKHRNDYDWKVTILYDDRIRNAFTLPGGHIYVYTGLLKFLNAEHELMAVLGNEIAYADAEFSALAMRDEYGGVFMGDIILGKKLPELPEVVADFPKMRFDEDVVKEADQYAIELICPFQYDINGLERFLIRGQAHEIEWLKSKKGEELEMSTRLELLKTKTRDCGEGGVTNLEQYQRKIKNFLPK